jgi:hypothetical protein
MIGWRGCGPKAHTKYSLLFLNMTGRFADAAGG